MMRHITRQSVKGQWTAILVLVLGLAVTGLGWWRERELARRGQVIRWQDSFAQLNPVLVPLIGQRFDAIRDTAKATLLRGGVSDAIWNDFLQLAEWQQRFPGMMEIGYAEPQNGFAKVPIKFVAGRPPGSFHSIGFDLNSEPAIREGVLKTADAGYGLPSRELTLGSGSNAVQVVFGFLPLPFVAKRPGTPMENRANVRGVLFFALNQSAYFRFCQPQLASLPIHLSLIPASEPLPPKTTTERGFTLTTVSGEWRLLATAKSVPLNAMVPQLVVLFGGLALSLLLFQMFSTQSRLRYQAELSQKKLLGHDAEIRALNRDLETKITVRTAELHEALAEEKELNRLKSNFISMVTHEIRTPLSLILGSSEILSRYLDRLSLDKRAEHLATIDSAVERMSALIDDVLLFSRAEAGRMEFNPVLIDLKAFCVQLVDELASATNRRCPIDLSTREFGEPARGDESLLRHVFANLLTNAAKYSAPGVPIQLAVRRDVGDAIFVVTDRGMGIPEEDRKRLFTPFYRGKNVATIQGTGLGLVIVKHCVERHGGRINVESADHGGTKVTVRMPLFSPAHTEFLKKLSESENPESK